jgi:hypothetical protein
MVSMRSRQECPRPDPNRRTQHELLGLVKAAGIEFPRRVRRLAVSSGGLGEGGLVGVAAASSSAGECPRRPHTAGGG